MFQSTLLLEGAFCGGKGYKKEKVGGDAHIAPPKQHLRSVLFSAAMSKPSGGIRSLPSLSACGLPTPVVALACICDVDIRVFSGAGVSILPPLKGVTPHGVGRCPQGRGDRSVRGEPPLGGGGVPSQSVTSSAAMSKPSGGIRSLPSLSACGLPTPIVALACICDVDIQVFSGAGG